MNLLKSQPNIAINSTVQVKICIKRYNILYSSEAGMLKDLRNSYEGKTFDEFCKMNDTIGYLYGYEN